MDENTLYKLGPNVGLIPCKSKDQKFLNGSIYFFRDLANKLNDADFKRAILMFCDFAAVDGTLKTPGELMEISWRLCGELTERGRRIGGRRFERFKEFGLLQPLLTNERPNELTIAKNDSIPSPVVGPHVPPSVSGLQNKEKKKVSTSHLGNARWEAIISLYPKRVGGLGRSTALKRLSKVEDRWPEFLTAIRNYKSEVEKNGSDGTKFVKQVSTFINCWEDYLTPTVEETYEERTWRENS